MAIDDTGTSGPQRAIALTAVLLLAAGTLAVGYKLWLKPQSEQELVAQTGAPSQYRTTVHVALDSFSGYAPLRTVAFADALRHDGIKLELHDDKADYKARLAGLAQGKSQFAVFPLDAYLTAGHAAQAWPASVVAVLDETVGADAVVAGPAVKNVADLDDPAARLVLTPGSPSELLARVLLAHFSLGRLPANWLEPADGAAQVYARFRADPKTAKKAYVLWEPYVSKAVHDGAHVLLDSGKVKGMIIDTLVVERRFLSEHPDVVEQVVAAWLRTVHAASLTPDGLATLVADDAKAAGEPLTAAQARQLAAGVHWKNTLENYAHFGLQDGVAGRGDHLEDAIDRVVRVLVTTHALAADPLPGRASTILFPGALKAMKERGFHPGKALAVMPGPGAGTAGLDSATVLAKVTEPAPVPALAPAAWAALQAVGTMRVEPIEFTRGTADLSIQAQRDLDDIVGHLDTLPAYYLRVEGHARAAGDADENLKLAQARADAVVQYLLLRHVVPERVHALAVPPSSAEGEAQSVSFVLGTPPY
ncbi:MAG: hypothetical protein EXR79_02470 [Myxococcales bacterium]|nr:hypothetical protein [Myxococcales bacterium]